MKQILLITMMISAFAHAAAVKTGDVLAITIKGVPTEEQSLIGGEYPVSSDGKVYLPYLPSITASGLTTSALARKIESAYKAQRIYTTPTISIQSLSDSEREKLKISQDIQQFLTVSGQVGRPGPLPYRPGLKLIDAVSQSGPNAFAAQNRVELLRNGKITKYNMKIPAHMLVEVLPNDQITLKEKDWLGQ
jgi:protein involved in polysaccharide export with SLBB domain